MQSKRWVFTLNNYDQSHLDRIAALGGGVGGNGIVYLVVGKEVGESGTPHLQGFVVCETNQRLNAIRSLLAIGNPHFEPARGTSCEAATYCCKDGDFSEFGERPLAGRHKSPSVSDFCAYVRSTFQTSNLPPTHREIAQSFPSLYLRYGPDKLLSLSAHLLPSPELESAPLRPWQLDLERQLNEEPDDRSVIFVVDEEGGKGKSYFARWYYSKYPDRTQLLGVGKRDDIALAVDVSKQVFIFNVPRLSIEFLQYSILEMMKDRVIFSPKYSSTTKIMSGKVHVLVLTNEQPDFAKMTEDRYKIVNI